MVGLLKDQVGTSTSTNQTSPHTTCTLLPPLPPLIPRREHGTACLHCSPAPFHPHARTLHPWPSCQSKRPG